MLSASVIGLYYYVCAVCLVGSRETTGTNFFSMAVRLPVRERSTRKRRSSACSSSFLLTSDSHMAQVADKLARKTSKASGRPSAKPKRNPSNKVKALKSKQDLTRCAQLLSDVWSGKWYEKRRWLGEMPRVWRVVSWELCGSSWNTGGNRISLQRLCVTVECCQS